jgi:dsRNA-specific ribonuclease
MYHLTPPFHYYNLMLIPALLRNHIWTWYNQSVQQTLGHDHQDAVVLSRSFRTHRYRSEAIFDAKIVRSTAKVSVRLYSLLFALNQIEDLLAIHRLRRILFGHGSGNLAHPTSQSIVGEWKPLWPRQSLPIYDDRPLQILDRLSDEGKRKLFTHQSVDSVCNYEELEWVGDAALELLARRMISRRYPKLKLGEKSVRRRLPTRDDCFFLNSQR